MAEYVYCISSGDAIKIGIATDPLKRLRELQTANAKPLHLVWTVQTGCVLAREAEKRLHHWLRRHRLQGEWFSYDEKKGGPRLRGIVERFVERAAWGDVRHLR